MEIRSTERFPILLSTAIRGYLWYGRPRADAAKLSDQPLAFLCRSGLHYPPTQVANLSLPPLAATQFLYGCCCHVFSSRP